MELLGQRWFCNLIGKCRISKVVYLLCPPPAEWEGPCCASSLLLACLVLGFWPLGSLADVEWWHTVCCLRSLFLKRTVQTKFSTVITARI